MSSMLRAGDYTIGWICALPVELAAAQHMLDEEHDVILTEPSDDNKYYFGRVGPHNIVIVCLPMGQIGTNMAGSVAAQMRSHFPAVRFGLMVGVGGGVPSEGVDIRLGDVVISVPQAKSPGVVQYDMGKAVASGKFERTGFLNPPPSALLKVLPGIKAKHMRKKTQLPMMLEQFNKLSEDGFVHPGVETDHLFESAHEHPPNESESCIRCDKTRCVKRIPRNSTTPRLHYGTIASGNQIIKNAKTREARSLMLGGVLCFEMEAAGLMNNFPCLVIRGICDYADSHKNKKWQPYAAATAAASAKEVLLELTPADVIYSKSLEELLETTRELKHHIEKITSHHDDGERRKLSHWLSSADNVAQQNELWKRHQRGTSNWVLEHPELTKWLNEKGQTLFCPGYPGAGKTMVTCAVVEYLQAQVLNHESSGLCYVYCNYKKHQAQNIDYFLTSMLEQLVWRGNKVPHSLKSLYNNHEPKRTRPSPAEYIGVIVEVMNGLMKNFILIDGLDECSNHGGLRKKLLEHIFEIQRLTGANILVTSRPMPDITGAFKGHARIQIRADDLDVSIYLQSRFVELSRCVLTDTALQAEIKAVIIRAADGIFLLAELHLRSLTDKFTPRTIRDALNTLSKGVDGLDELYEGAKVRIESQSKDSRNLAKQILSWIVYAERQLTTFELQHALAVVEGDVEFDESNLVDSDDMIKVCEGLVTIDPEQHLVRFVHYTVQEYIEKIRDSWLPDGHMMIARACLTYLGFDGMTEDYLFFDFAAHFWGDHARRAGIKRLELMSISSHHLDKALYATQQLATEDARLGRIANIPGGLVPYPGHPNKALREAPWTYLHLAAYFGLKELTVDCLTQTHPLDSKDSLDWTPLMWAIVKGHEAVSQLLIKSSLINVALCFPRKRSILHVAAGLGRLIALEALLLHRNIELDLKDDNGRTPFAFAVVSKQEEAAILIMTLTSVDVGACDRMKRTPLSYAAEFGLISLATAIMDRQDHDANIIDCFFHVPLSYASRSGCTPIVKLLLESGRVDANILAVGMTPLMLAVKAGHEAVVSCFLASKAININSKGSDGATALAIAAKHGNSAIVKSLLNEREIEVNTKDCRGKFPLVIAAERGHWEIVGLLFDTGRIVIGRQDDYHYYYLNILYSGYGTVTNPPLDTGIFTF